MAKPFLTDESKAALAEAVRAVESCSSAELVVAVRPRSGSWLHADLMAGSGILVFGRSLRVVMSWATRCCERYTGLSLVSIYLPR